MMIERLLEKKLRAQAKLNNIVCAKWTSPGETGVPDDILFHPDGTVHFVELKTKGGSLSAKQRWWLDRLTRYGQTCYVIKGELGLELYFKGELEPWK
jgi:hypothetical protein